MEYTANAALVLGNLLLTMPGLMYIDSRLKKSNARLQNISLNIARNMARYQVELEKIVGSFPDDVPVQDAYSRQGIINKFTETVGYFLNFNPEIEGQCDPFDAESVRNLLEEEAGRLPAIGLGRVIRAYLRLTEVYDGVSEVLDCSETSGSPLKPTVYFDRKPENYVIDERGLRDMVREIDFHHIGRWVNPAVEPAKFTNRPSGSYTVDPYTVFRVINALEYGSTDELVSQGTKMYPAWGLMHTIVNINRYLSHHIYSEGFLRTYYKEYAEVRGIGEIPEQEWALIHYNASVDVSLRNLGYSQKRDPQAPDLLYEQLVSGITALAYIHKVSITSRDDLRVNHQSMGEAFKATKELVRGVIEMIYEGSIPFT